MIGRSSLADKMEKSFGTNAGHERRVYVAIFEPFSRFRTSELHEL